MHNFKINGMVALLFVLSIQIPAFAALGDNFSLSFYNITTPAVAADELDGETNLSLLVTDIGSNKVSFKFTNNSNFSSRNPC